MLKENNHSAFSLHYELVLVSKNKAPIFDEKIVKLGREIFENISSSYQIELKGMHYEKDHMHFKFEAYPTTNLSKFINAYKSASSRKIKNSFPEITKYLKDGIAMWEANYFLVTVGINSKDLVLHYIEQMIKCDEFTHEHDTECSE